MIRLSSLATAGLALFVVLTVHVRADEPEQPTVITSTSLDMWSNDTETHAIFKQNVEVTGTNLKLTCDRLEVTATRIGDKTLIVGNLQRFKHLLAVGKVHIIQEDREAFCGKAEVLPHEEKIILTEKPMVKDNSSGYVATGEPLILERGQRRVTGENVKFTGPPVKDLGYDKAQPPTRPEPTATPTAAPTSPAKPAPTAK